ncbi:phospholipid carrier-dependent glycosyltransferase [Lusitaniella coriacea]|uniref:phospholipid carrier-dependent glycosyltransferase n=1 Tax=Lusitaniella coriacea TaxID=1983105 RepID=UPI003CE808D9
MNRQLFAWDRLKSKISRGSDWLESLQILGVLSAALILFCTNLGEVPLLGAILAALSTLLLYWVGRELFPRRDPALFSALIYLTCWPILCAGRGAGSAGAMLCCLLLAMLFALRSRRDLRWSLGAGLAMSALGCVGAIQGVLLGAIALLFLAWDTPRLLRSWFFWLGGLLGVAPAIAWYGVRGVYWHEPWTVLMGLEGARSDVFSGLWLLALCLYALPWLPIFTGGLQLAQENWNWSWAKLVWLWSGCYLFCLFLFAHWLTLSILPIYPPLALAGGAVLAEVYAAPRDRPYPRFWALSFMATAILATGACLYWSFQDFALGIFFAAIALTLGVTALSIERQDSQFIISIFWGLYVSLLLFVNSPHWLWIFEIIPMKSLFLS